MSAHGPVLAAVVLAALVCTTLAVTLAIFAGQVVPQAARDELVAAPDTSVLVSGSLAGSPAAGETVAVRAAMRSAFGRVPFAFYTALWSAPLPLQRAGANSPQAATAVEAVAAAGIQANSMLTAGRWPPASPQDSQPIPAALDAAAAGRLDVSAGDLLTLRPAGSSRPVLVRVTGLFRPRDPTSAFWRLDLIGPGGAGRSGRLAVDGPLVVSAASLRGPLAAGSASWVAKPAMASIPEGDLMPLAGQLAQQKQLMLDSATLGNLTMTTGLPTVLGATGANLVVAQSLLVIAGLQLLLLIATALGLTARLLAGQRQAEYAQLAARGAARWQLAGRSGLEAGLVTAVAAAGGLLAGGLLARLLARAGPLGAAGLSTSPTAAGACLTAVATGVACAAVAAMAGAVPGPRPRGEASGPGRPGAVRETVQAGADVALVALAAVAVWELRRYSAVSASPTGTLGVDPVLALAPALALAAGTVVLLRLVPVAARATDWLAARGRRLATPLASWQIGRSPVNQAGAALLVVLTVATGTFVLSLHQSWLSSAQDQAMYTAGADVRVDTPQPAAPGQAEAIAAAPGVRAAMPVAQLGYGSVGQGMALDAATAARVVLLRPDLSALPEAALFRRITPDGGPPGLMLPGRAARLRVIASLGPIAQRRAVADVTLSVQDADGVVYALPAGRLPADGRTHPLDATITSGAAAIYPLRLLAITLTYPLPHVRSWRAATLTVDGITASPRRSGPFGAPFAAGSAVRGWRHSVSLATGQVTLTAATDGGVIGGLATQSYLRAAGVRVGTTVQVAVAGASVPVKIVAPVAGFPPISGPGGAVIVDLAALQEALSARALPPAPVSQWWLATTDAPAGQPGLLPGHEPPGLPGRLPAGATVTVAGQLAAGLRADSLSAAPQQVLLGVAAAAGLLALAGLSVAIMAKVTERGSQRAVLSALGMSRGSQAWTFCLEQLMLSLPSAAAGLALGATLAWLTVPAVTLTASAAAPTPSALTEFAWPTALPLAAVVAVVPVLAAALAMARRPDPAAQLRTLGTA
ncbi:MAG TPA: FtsX-like permease family protein [Trebonia sp.]|nr:FtsX-like permease family protein [Trebonia sp.]